MTTEEKTLDKNKKEEASKGEETKATEKKDEKKDSHSDGGCCGVCGG